MQKSDDPITREGRGYLAEVGFEKGGKRRSSLAGSRFLSEGHEFAPPGPLPDPSLPSLPLHPDTEPITESGIKGAPRRRINARGEKNFSLSDLSIREEERKRERESWSIRCPLLKVNNRLETTARHDANFLPETRWDIFLPLAPLSLPLSLSSIVSIEETRDSLYRALYLSYRFLRQLSRSNRFFIQFTYASRRFQSLCPQVGW